MAKKTRKSSSRPGSAKRRQALDPRVRQLLVRALELRRGNQREQAVELLRQAAKLAPKAGIVWEQLAGGLIDLNHMPAARDAFGRAAKLQPGAGWPLCNYIALKLKLCDWDGLPMLTKKLFAAVRADAGVIDPLTVMMLDAPADIELLAARQYTAQKAAALAGIPPFAHAPPAAPEDRLTIGYLSPDLRDHPVGYLMGEVIRRHDRKRFRVNGYFLDSGAPHPVRQTLVKSFDHQTSLRGLPPLDAARRIFEDGVDLLIDLGGLTANTVPEIALLRPAPVQAAYLGYPGTMGTEAVDYLLADGFVIPPDAHGRYVERIVSLPGCYLPWNSGRETAPIPPGRTACGLPEKGFVFGALHGYNKVTREMFGIWMDILTAVPDSVLWLSAAGGELKDNLLREAASRGIGPERLAFAPRVADAALHLARLRHMDLFLDTAPYNAHSTAAEVLHAGCPVLTCAGASFPSRVAGSLLTSLALPELITESLDAYRQQAIRLARDPDARAALRARLAEGKRTRTFDPVHHTRRLEAAYERMWAMHRQGARPAPFTVDM